MKILLARHGETPWNAEGRYQGQVDIPLSDLGIAQATALGERLMSLRIDRAVASPLARATRTAQLALGVARASRLGFDDGFLEIRPRRMGRPAGQRDRRARSRAPARLARGPRTRC